MKRHEGRKLFADGPQRVLVTGATGFIGRILCQELLADGHTLVLWVRNPEKAKSLLGDGPSYITRLEDLSPSMAIDVVINLAGEPVLGRRWTAVRKVTVLNSRVHTTKAIVDWIARAEVRPRQMISASAIGFYGVQPASDISALMEASPGQPIFMSELCQRWEQEARRVEGLGVPLVLLRLGVVFGHMGALPMMLLPYRFGFGVRYGAGNQVVSWIHIRDVIRAIAHLMNAADGHEKSGAYNITAPEPVTQQQFLEVAGKLRKRPWAMPVPAWLFRWMLGEQAMLLVDGQRVHPSRLLEEGFQFDFPQLKDALLNLA